VTSSELAPLQLYASGIISEDLHRLVEAAKDEVHGRARAQFLFSYIITTESWQDAKIWVNRATGEIYEEERDIPTNERTHYSVADKWGSQEAFTVWCEGNVPGFARATMWKRHSVIDKLVEMGMEMPQAVWVVAGLRMVTASSQVAGLFSYTEANEFAGPGDVSAIKNLPTLSETLTPEVHEELLTADEEEAAAIVEDHLDSIRDAARRFIAELAARVEKKADTPSQVSTEAKRVLKNTPKIHFFSPGKETGYDWAIRITTYDHEKGSYDTGNTRIYYLCFIDEKGFVLSELPPEAREWWEYRIARRAKGG
jgi:hypothetical protein